MADDTNTLRLHLDSPSPARIYDYLLDPESPNNYAIDRGFAEDQLAKLPDLRKCVRENRRFAGRVVETAIERGIRQFIDIGSGLPSIGQPHDIADRLAPGEATVVYVDNEVIAHAHANVLLDQHADPDRHKAVLADFFNIIDLWKKVLKTEVINEEEPICLLVNAVLHFMSPEAEPETPMRKLRNSTVPGSLLAITTAGVIPGDEDLDHLASEYIKKTTSSAYLRHDHEILPFFGDWELLPPGLTWPGLWRPKTDRSQEPWWTEDSRGGEPWWGNQPERIRYRAAVAENPAR